MVSVTVLLGVCVRTASPLGSLYDPNMSEDQTNLGTSMLARY